MIENYGCEVNDGMFIEVRTIDHKAVDILAIPVKYFDIYAEYMGRLRRVVDLALFGDKNDKSTQVEM